MEMRHDPEHLRVCRSPDVELEHIGVSQNSSRKHMSRRTGAFLGDRLYQSAELRIVLKSASCTEYQLKIYPEGTH